MYQALGPAVVPSAGSPITLTVLLPVEYPTWQGVMHAVMLQALQANIGRIYVGSPGLNKSTLAFCGNVLAPYTVIPYHTMSAALTISPNGLAMASFVLDADNNGEGVLVSILRT